MTKGRSTTDVTPTRAATLLLSFRYAFAGIVYYADDGAPLALVGPEFAPYALIAGTLVFVALLASLYRFTARVRL